MKTLFLVGMLFCVSYAAVENATRIPTDIQAMEYNDLSSTYMPRPTFVTIYRLSNGTNVLSIQMDTYAKNKRNPQGRSSMPFIKDRFPDYAKAIDKYLEWSAIAKQRKDALTKEIGLAPTVNGGSLRFTFHSGNEKDHFLVIAFHFGFVDADNPQTFDESNAKKLRSLLEAFAADKLFSTDVDSIYK